MTSRSSQPARQPTDLPRSVIVAAMRIPWTSVADDRRRGFLLVEAMLTALVIAVGLVFISRGVGGSLKALASLQEYDRLIRVAESRLHELESLAQLQQAVEVRDGAFEPPDERYGWSITVEPFPVAELADGALCLVTLRVSPLDDPHPMVRVQTVWPSTWTASVCA